MTGDDLDRRLSELESRAGDGGDGVLVIGGGSDRAGVMSEAEYLAEYSEAERGGHVEGGSNG